MSTDTDMNMNTGTDTKKRPASAINDDVDVDVDDVDVDDFDDDDDAGIDDDPSNLKKPKTGTDTDTVSTANMTPLSSQGIDDNNPIYYNQTPTEGEIEGKEEEMKVSEEEEDYTTYLSNKIRELSQVEPSPSNSSSATGSLVFDSNNKNIRDLLLLAGSDSVHDFKPTRCGDVQTCNIVSSKLLPALNSLSDRASFFREHIEKYTDPNNLDAKGIYSNWLKTAFDRRVTSSSENEDQTVDYFENKFPFELVQETVTLTYRDILHAIKTNPNNSNNINTAIKESVDQLVGNATVMNLILADDETPKDWEKYPLNDKIYIGLFILNFYFPPGDNANLNTQTTTYFTFDAVSEIPSNIFGLMDQVVNLVTPLNIADSATAESHLIPKTNGKRSATAKRNGVKNYYYFPYNDEQNLYNYSSNIYTYDRLNLSLVPNPVPTSNAQWSYNEKNKYDFTIQIRDKSNDSLISGITFDSDQKSGPSVNYLSSLVSNPDQAVPNSKMINLITMYNEIEPKLGNITDMLLFDLKRTGDWEQCNAAKNANEKNEQPHNKRTILCTGDRLCALYSRCIGQHTMYQLTTLTERTLNLYRFNVGSGTGNLSFVSKLLTKLKTQNQIMNELFTKINESLYLLNDSVINVLKQINFPESLFLQDMVTKLIKQTKTEFGIINKTANGITDNNISKIDALLSAIGNSENPLNDPRFIDLISKETLSIPDNLKENLNQLSEIFGHPLTAELTMDDFRTVIYSAPTSIQQNKIKSATNYIDFFTNFNTKITSTKKIDFRLGFCNFAMLQSIGTDIKFLMANTASDRNLQKEDYSVKLKDYISNLQYIYDTLCVSGKNRSGAENFSPMMLTPEVGASPQEEEKCQIIQDIINTKYVMPPNEPFTLAKEHQNRIIANRDYKNTLQTKTNILIDSYGVMMDGSGGGQSKSNIKKIIKGGAVADKNLLDNLEAFLVNEFLILTASISEIAYDLEIPDSSFDDIIKTIKTKTISEKSKLEIETAIMSFIHKCTDKILETESIIYEDFDVDDGIGLASLYPIKLKKLKEIFASICYFFAFSYFNYLTVDARTINLFKGSRDVNSFQILYKKTSADFGFDDETKGIIDDFGLFDQRAIRGQYTLTTSGNNILTMLQFSRGLRDSGVQPENIVLLVFLFFQNYFKYVMTKLPEYGYSSGIIVDFTNDTNIITLFEKLFLTIKRRTNTTINSEFIANTQIFNESSTIIYHLLAYIKNPGVALDLARLSASLASPSSRGGKRKTRKLKSNTRKKRSQRAKHQGVTRRAFKRHPSTSRKARKSKQ